MRRGEALPSSFLGKDDFTQPVLCQIAHVVMEDVKSDRGEERKPVLYIMGPSRPVDTSRGIILNVTMWETLEELTGQPDSDQWKNTQIVVYVDPDVRFGGKRVGGIRIRAPKQQHPGNAASIAAAGKAKPAPAAEEYDETNPPPPGDGDAIEPF